MDFKDQLQRTVSLKNTPARIVSLVPSQTELLVDLGLRDRIVGITKFCVHPKNLRESAVVVGGTKSVHIDKIEELNPDIIICNKEENTAEMVAELEEIATVWVSDIISIEDSFDMILKLGEIFDVSDNAKKLVSNLIQKRDEFYDFIKNRPSLKVFYLIWKNPYMCVGDGTFINTILELNNFENLGKRFDTRYPEISEDNFQTADIIFLSTEPYPFKEEDVQIFQKNLNVNVKLVNGEYFSWYGSRLLDAFNYFKQLHA
ncbi:ABC transporter substrate-binding protein [Aequorivita echinoideorum]|uniref:ABC transporter substrate-binding protein n=1 Tax=Aequorivita echinoideorum TaxID=1549647 RepID=A0ABS5S4X5_9FLAO|nr:helical backbone metal receptor [Aequorivita echinoideorum]MBT0608269.1 ABC transporter substrate-binding protein [Aequorivita echinoideorum]